VKKSFLIAAIVVTAVLLGIFHYKLKRVPDDKDLQRSAHSIRGQIEWQNKTAPDFELTTLNGEKFRLADNVGQKTIVLNFFATWCAPCRAEMPYFETTYRAYQERGVVFVGLALDDLPQDSQAFLHELGITYPTGPDQGGEIAQRYQVGGLPTTIFITRDGTLARKWLGALSEQQLLANVAEIAR